MKIGEQVNWLKGIFGAGVLMGLLAGCAGPNGVGTNYGEVAPAPMAGAGETAAVASDSTASSQVLNTPIQKRRPGLGTGWGEEKDSAISYTHFRRGKLRGTEMIFYNDAEGVDAMKGSWSRRGDGMQKAAGGIVEWGVKSGWGYAKNVMGGGKRFVVGTRGKEYAIVVRNLCKARVEVVLSVDGLDVMDGRGASIKKRGYIVGPGKSLTISGFRTSEEAVAAFKFSTVAGSYSNQRHGSTRNVGVIGMAVYTEFGVDPWKWSKKEMERRKGARAFAEAPAVRAR